MRTLAFVPLSILMVTPSYALINGVYCKGKMSFIARAEPSGSLAFKIMGSTREANVIEVAGIARQHASGWRYQITSTSSPDDRCTLDITESNGGYAVRSVEGARCQSSGGSGAYLLIKSVAFTAGTKLSNISVPNGPPDDYPAIDCMQKNSFNFIEHEKSDGNGNPVLSGAQNIHCRPSR